MSSITVRNADFLVVGAGVIGLATAWELARTGASVTVLDRGPAGREASWAGGGLLFALWPWEYAEPVTALAEMGRLVYADWVAGLNTASGIDCEYRQTGLLALPPMDFGKAAEWCASRQLRAEMVAGAAVSPLLASHGQALWLPDVAQVRNPRLLQALVHGLRGRQVAIQEDMEVLGVLIERGRATGVRTPTGVVSAGAVIVCAGAWSSELLGRYSEGADIFPVLGQMLLYATAPETLPAMVLQGDRYLIPRADGLILAGSTKEMTGFEKNVTAAAAADLHASAVAMLPALQHLQPVRQWAGLRPGSPGNVPVIGAHPYIEGLYLNSGHFRYGLTMAPAAADGLANLALGIAPTLNAADYGWPEKQADKVDLLRE